MNISVVWRIGWAVLSFLFVETLVCGIAAVPTVLLWKWLLETAWPSTLLTVFAFSLAIVPSYISFALCLAFVSPLVRRLAGWQTPPDTAMRIADMDWQLLTWARYAASNHVVRVVAGTVFRGSPVWTAHLRLSGARIGRRVYVNSLSLVDYNLLRLGNDVIIGAGVHLSGHTVENGVVKTARVTIGDDVTIGVSSIVEIGSEVGSNCRLGAMSFVPKYSKLEARGVYVGIPAKRIE